MTKTIARKKRQQRFRKNFLKGADATRPRLVVYRSNQSIYAQLVDDNTGKTLISGSSMKMKKGKPMDQAKELGHEIGKKIKEQKIEKIAFDKNGFKYHGKIKALADAVREEGIQF